MNSRGERTRDKIVEWELTPMEFGLCLASFQGCHWYVILFSVYVAPFLYVVHCESLEIMQVFENDGSSRFVWFSWHFVQIRKDFFKYPTLYPIPSHIYTGKICMLIQDQDNIKIQSLPPDNVCGGAENLPIAITSNNHLISSARSYQVTRSCREDREPTAVAAGWGRTGKLPLERQTLSRLSQSAGRMSLNNY